METGRACTLARTIHLLTVWVVQVEEAAMEIARTARHRDDMTVFLKKQMREGERRKKKKEKKKRGYLLLDQ